MNKPQKIFGDPPTLMQIMPNWVMWGWRDIDGDRTRIPFDCVTFKGAKSTSRSTWSTYKQARSLLWMNRYDGISFMLDDGVFGIDLDGCINNGVVASWAKRILKMFPTYSEISPSGTGIKLYGIGHKRAGTRCMRFIDATHPKKKPAIEVYGFGKPFAFTGKRFGNITEMYDCQRSLDRLIEIMTPPREPRSMSQRPTTTTEQFRMQKAREWLGNHGPAVQGSNGSTHTFAAALALLDGFELPEEIVVELMFEWNACCQPPWNESDLMRKIESAARVSSKR